MGALEALQALVSQVRALGLTHAWRHISGGPDEISLTGLGGESADAIAKSLLDANTIIKADSDNTPVALAIAASRILGRKSSGGIAALTAADVATILVLTNYILKSVLGANSILKADSASTPVALSVAASRILGRKSTGSIAALTAAEVIALLGADWLTGAMLSSTFGATAGRLYNFIPIPIDGAITQITNAAKSGFVAKIHAAGAGGLTATNVPYDGDTKEDMFNGLKAYDGAGKWGQIVLHNLTRGNSRKIVSVNVATNVIVTTSSTDDWADNDDITSNSQTCAVAGIFDWDLSAKVAATTVGLLMRVSLRDNEGAYDAARSILLASYQAWPQPGWIFNCPGRQANDWTENFPVLAVIDQKVCCYFGTGVEDIIVDLQVIGTIEYADT